MTLRQRQQQVGALLAADGIPLHFGDQRAEYHAALESAVLMDRSHEGGLELHGRDRLSLPHRISTNDLESLPVDSGRPTLFTNPNGRVIERAMIYNRGETALAISEPGHVDALRAYLSRNIFFNDELRVVDTTPLTHKFALHGPNADAVIARWQPELTDLPALGCRDLTVDGATIFVGRRKPLSGAHWLIVTPIAQAADVWSALLTAGADLGLIPAGSLTYHALRVRAGVPGAGGELSTDYIPLELGLWDEVSFHKGCYTGQEIIARMESRGRLAKTIVTLRLTESVESPAPLLLEGRQAGILTSSVTTPDDEHLGIGVIKLRAAQVGIVLDVAESGAHAEVLARAGVQPAAVADEDEPNRA
jgi:aminomethyltransferase